MRRFYVLLTSITLLTLVISGYLLATAPATIATHLTHGLHADQYGSRWQLLILIVIELSGGVILGIVAHVNRHADQLDGVKKLLPFEQVALVAVAALSVFVILGMLMMIHAR